MEREQEDREGSRRMMDVMDDGAESRFRALTAASVLHVLQQPSEGASQASATCLQVQEK